MTATGIYLDAELNTTGRAYWAMSRMVNHGWSVLSFGLDCGGWLRLRTPAGVELPVAADPIDHTPSSQQRIQGQPSVPLLPLHACRLLHQCAHERAVAHRGDDAARTIAAMLRLGMPAGRAHSDDARCPWYLPHHGAAQPPESVRRAYWAATTLTDDYGWRITGVDARGFTAVGPYDEEEVRYRSATAADCTTSGRLTRLLAAVATDGCTGHLERLILEHQHVRRNMAVARS